MQQISKAKTIKIFFFAFLLFAAGTTNAQVGIGTPTPAASAQLDVTSTNKGFLPPRMTYLQRLAIANPDRGLIIWCKNCGASGELQVYNGTRWTNLVGDIVPPFQIGDNYGGGIVFSVSDDGQHGYIAAFENLGPTLWSSAEKLCADYRGGGYRDWVFPSSDQVTAMFNLDHILFPGSLGLGGTAGTAGYIFYGRDAPNAVAIWDERYGAPGKCCYIGFTDVAPVRPIRSFGGTFSPPQTIGSQVWTTTNLDAVTYRNGDLIPEVENPAVWDTLTSGAWCYYDHNSAKGAIYGKLYNWYAVHDSRGLAPEGWHVASDDEWNLLTVNLGGPSVAGAALKETGTSHWKSPNNGTNSSGFTALPGGMRQNSAYTLLGNAGAWWTSSQTPSTQYAWFREINYYDAAIYRWNITKQTGFSVRCVKD